MDYISVVMLLNLLRTPSSILNGKTPYELLFGFEPSLDHLRTFGCLCFSTILNNPDKFESHAEKCVFLGYSPFKKGYKLWSLDQRKILFSRDVKFYETIFPFKDNKLLNEDLSINDSFLNSLNFFNFFDSRQPDEPNGETPNDEERAFSEVVDIDQQPSTDHQAPDGMATSQQPQGTNEGAGEADNVETTNDNSSSPEGTNDPSEPIRRSTRSSSIPKKFNDFIIEGKVKYGMEKVVNYSKLSFENKCFTSCLNKSIEPRNLYEAKNDSNWVTAMNEEMEALNRNNTWTLVDLPEGRKPIGCKWVYKIKYKSIGEIERYKARLVAKGYSQKEGVDFDETFSPVVKMVTVRCLISLAVERNWPLFQLDINNAFLYGSLNEEVYMCLPEGFFSKHETKVCKLNKSLYGLKQAPRMWNEKLVSDLVEFDFIQSKCDHSLFIKSKNSVFIALLVYVDDIVITGNNSEEINKVKQLLNTSFSIKDLGLLKYFLGIEVFRNEQGVCLSQRKFCMDLLAEFGLSGCKAVSTPIEQHYTVMNFCKKDESVISNITNFQKLIGKLIYKFSFTNRFEIVKVFKRCPR
ncbi:putative RNA-directed DNA polymerase [Helianthus annuus]|uniref:RNA-directed DNA polymerase n=1 Tax=Helianthus annuus TaxID=4232 RepID=A0A9K3E5U6_HELAN|nr:putative RNA-directed DNA polymerase [Helianthus annuus]KAJ0959617.1 putative RNA-directed DNA polymerase [Helianthus annuus]